MKKLSSEVQDVDRCVNCGHDAADENGICRASASTIEWEPCLCKCVFPSTSVSEAFEFHEFVGIGAGELGMTPCEACGALERDPVHADKFRVSEAEEKNSVSPKPKAPSHSPVVVSGDSLESAIPEETELEECLRIENESLRAELGQIYARELRDDKSAVCSRGAQIGVTFNDPQRELIAVLVSALEVAINTVECDSLDKDGCELPWHAGARKALALAGAITQAGASASALSTTVPDHSPASLTESSSESESTLVTEVSKEQDNAKS